MDNTVNAILLILFSLLTLYCMFARTAARGTTRLTTAAIPRSRAAPVSTSPLFTRTLVSPTISTRPQPATVPIRPRVMLRGAVQKHEKENVRATAASQKLFTSSPPEPPDKKSIQSISQGYRNPLVPSTSAAVNGVKSSVQPRQSGGVKRTASGLAKTLVPGAFDDDMESQHRPIMVNDGVSVSRVATLLDFDEDDFPSDVDLDVEDPVSKVNYPKLPQQPPTMAVGKPILHPTLPMQAQVLSSFGKADSSAISNYGPPDRTQAAPKSSQPFAWSSSPPQHHQPAALEKFAFKPIVTTQATQDGPKSSKRRFLPWQNEISGPGDDMPRHSTGSSASRVNGAEAFTPLPRDNKKASYPWNTTASAIKEQQKQHRAEVKKASKAIGGTDDDVAKAKSARVRPARVFLSEEQQHVLELVLEKKNSVFFTGSAGTGKSVLMREIISALRKKYQREPDRVAVTASTGLAACNVGGVTLHSFAGIGLGKEDVPELVRKIKRNQKAKHRWIRTKVLIIDEVSMVDGELFDKLEAIARNLRNNGRPFGGIQLVITGDFFQLPPVPDYGKVAKFAFDASTWPTTIEHTIGLHHVFRQKDPIFAGMLNEMREGRLSDSSIKTFRSLYRDLKFEDAMEATELFPTRSEVDKANNTRLSMLQGAPTIFEARDGGAIVDKAQRDKLLQNCMAPELITLKKGAQVMLIKNVDDSLVNGSLGRVIGFMDETTFDRYHATDGDMNDGDQGQNLEDRARSRVITTSKQYPVVRFTIPDGTSRDLLCQPESWKVELPNGEVQASRSQVPLILAWALSIHKAQGQTLERVKVDLGKVFEKGQAYVALSRATSMAGLQVLRFDPKKVNAHDRVRNFYANLVKVELTEKAGEQEKAKKKSGVGMAAEGSEKRFVEDEWPDIE